MFCGYCGANIPDDSVRCPVCDKTLPGRNAEPKPAEPEQPSYGSFSTAYTERVQESPRFEYEEPEPDSFESDSEEEQPAEPKANFLDTGLGIVLTVALLIISVIGLIISGMDIGTPMLINIGSSFLGYALISLAMAVTTRAKGMDHSFGAVMTLCAYIIAVCAMNGSVLLGIVLAVSAAAVIGLISGVLITYLRIHAIFVTIVMASLVTGVRFLCFDAMPVMVDGILFARSLPLAYVLTFLPAFAVVLVLIAFTSLKIPRSQRLRHDGSFMNTLAYAASAVIACLYGLFMVSRLSTAVPNMGTHTEISAIFLAAAIVSTRVTDNRFTAPVYALLPALTLTLITLAMTIMGWSSYIQMIVIAIVTLIMLAVTFTARRRTPMEGRME